MAVLCCWQCREPDAKSITWSAGNDTTASCVRLTEYTEYTSDQTPNWTRQRTKYCSYENCCTVRLYTAVCHSLQSACTQQCVTVYSQTVHGSVSQFTVRLYAAVCHSLQSDCTRQCVTVYSQTVHSSVSQFPKEHTENVLIEEFCRVLLLMCRTRTVRATGCRYFWFDTKCGACALGCIVQWLDTSANVIKWQQY